MFRITVLSVVCLVGVCLASDGIEKFLNKKYKLDKSENFDKCLEALGTKPEIKKAVEELVPVVELKKTGDVYTFFMKRDGFKDIETKFKLGEEFDEETPDGRKVKSVITMDGNKLIHKEKGDTPADSIIEFTPEGIKKTLTVKDIKCTRTFKLEH